jgi:thioredoxin 2
VLIGASRFEGAVLGAKVPVLVDFWSPTCPPCRVLAPELEKLARTKSGALLVAKVDTHAEPGLARRYGIEVVPTMILFEGGREVRRVTGAMPAAQIERSLGV